MPKFIVNRNAYQDYNGSDFAHEVHNVDEANGCLPDVENRIDLGYHGNCKLAVKEADSKLTWSPYKADGCKHCAPACNTR
ncbi:hypothetical protein SAMN04487965_0414 [Microbulbifer donghaiensis]|uniref:Uncharacterized protein n=1 Tax=Microbulbifer donghaiensis TaxID=494016 RepID=A0A1M4VFU2_9GAMM|nr:hypothetical protein [Microbulbifer donghaiensis]SHE67762.1 hypothetical protein SAMN04487965_0414 [Microbulbifer donghaiensis]